MNKILLILIVAVSMITLACSSNKTPGNNGNVSSETKSGDISWSTIDYHYRTGSVSPEYYYHYRIIANQDGSCQFIFYPSYEDTGFSQEQFKITDAQISQINDAVINSKVLTDNITQESDHPIGGSSESMSITMDQGANLDQMPKTISVPSFPEKKYAAGLEKLYSVLRNILPAGILQGAIDKKEGR